MIEIRWHARAGQGAKTASQIYAVAMLRAGKHVQAFPEYGPERRGAPLIGSLGCCVIDRRSLLRGARPMLHPRSLANYGFHRALP